MNAKKSKGLTLALLLMGGCLTTTAKTADSTFVMPQHSIYGELGGPCWGVSANWDARLKKDSHWGYQLGLGWAGQWDNMMGIHTHTMYYGLTTGKESDISIKSENKTQVRDFLYMNVGYRYTSTHGFQFRCGVTPMVNITNGWIDSNDNYSKGAVFLAPYISFGKAF